MLTSSHVKRINESPVFMATRSPYLVLDTELCIRAVNPAYEEATAREAEELLGAPMFEAFPANPDVEDDGAARLRESLHSVLSRGARHHMGLQRYDIPVPGDEPAFVYKVWAPVNSPILDDRGRTVGVLHHVEDVTPLIPLETGGGAPHRMLPDGPPTNARWVQLTAALHDARMAHAQTQTQYATLRRALDTNRQIATAIGILMSSNKVSQAGALQMLMRQSQRSHRKLRDVAAEIVTKFDEAHPDDVADFPMEAAD